MLIDAVGAPFSAALAGGLEVEFLGQGVGLGALGADCWAAVNIWPRVVFSLSSSGASCELSADLRPRPPNPKPRLPPKPKRAAVEFNGQGVVVT